MPIINDILREAGIDEKETEVYTTLLSNGGMTVMEIASKTTQKRTNLYNIIEGLKHVNLVREVKEKSTTKYYPQSPKEIEKLLERKALMMNHAKLNFDILLGSLQSQFILVENKPLITYFEGLQGLQRLYDDVIDTGEDILLLRSTYDDKRSDVDGLIAKQIVEQVKRGIHAKVIGPVETEEEAKELYTKYDRIRLVEEHFVTDFPFNLPAQILIYGSKTAISTIRKDIVITIIENKDVTNTFRVLFDFMWQYTKAEHEKLTKDWKQE